MVIQPKWEKIIKMQRLKPNAVFDGLCEIDYDFLKANNIKGILLDIDNTLIDMSKVLSEDIINWVSGAKKAGFKVMILSNTNKSEKLNPISKTLDIDYLSFAKKPAKSRLY